MLATEVTIRHRPAWTDELATFVGGILGRQGYPDYVNRHVLDTNEWLRELARRERLLLLDFEPVLSNGSGQRRRAFTSDDGSHITPAGYDALRRYALPLLTAHFGRRRPSHPAEHAARLQQRDGPVNALLDRNALRVDDEVGVRRRLVRRGDAGEVVNSPESAIA